MNIDPVIADVLKNYDLNPKEALWNCHGTWVIFHRYIEQAAARAGITFGLPQIIEASTTEKIAVVAVSGQIEPTETRPARTEWSFGEAAPYNNKNEYPWAMAEKRAKDRVALKLLGLHGYVYSEEEADDFKKPAHGELGGPLSKTDLKVQMRVFSDDLARCEDADMLSGLLASYDNALEQCKRDLPDWYYGKPESDVLGAAERIDEKKREFEKVEVII